MIGKKKKVPFRPHKRYAPATRTGKGKVSTIILGHSVKSIEGSSLPYIAGKKGGASGSEAQGGEKSSLDPHQVWGKKHRKMGGGDHFIIDGEGANVSLHITTDAVRRKRKGEKGRSEFESWRPKVKRGPFRPVDLLGGKKIGSTGRGALTVELCRCGE